jgi:hypothetical protein
MNVCMLVRDARTALRKRLTTAIEQLHDNDDCRSRHTQDTEGVGVLIMKGAWPPLEFGQRRDAGGNGSWTIGEQVVWGRLGQEGDRGRLTAGFGLACGEL